MNVGTGQLFRSTNTNSSTPHKARFLTGSLLAQNNLEPRDSSRDVDLWELICPDPLPINVTNAESWQGQHSDGRNVFYGAQNTFIVAPIPETALHVP
jgi:hypothetical protein